MTHYLCAHEIAQRVAAGKLSAREAVSASIHRIESTHEVINAIVVARFEEALKEADLADDVLARGGPIGPLHGVPFTVKESFDLAGASTTAGLTHRVNHRATQDSWIVTRLRQAGAIVLGKTNVSQLLLNGACSNPIYGRTNNPWALARSPGASSGGEGAVVAAGGSPLGIGSDIGGSVRLPAQACGIHCLKPTSGRIPMDGHLSIASALEPLMCQPGPMARSVNDLALSARVLFGQATDAPDFTADNIRGFRIGFYTDNGILKPSPGILRAVNAAAHALQDRGVIVEDWLPPNLELMWRVYTALVFAGGMTNPRKLARGSKLTLDNRQLLALSKLPRPAFSVAGRMLRAAGQRQIAESLFACMPLDAERYEALFRRRDQLTAGFLAAMDSARLDAILCPVFPVPAPPHRINMAINEGLSYTAVYNFLGLPCGAVAATRVRAGEESDRAPGFNLVERVAKQVETGSAGLPVGVQVVARHWREDVVLRIMSALEDHFRTQPDYPAVPPL